VLNQAALPGESQELFKGLSLARFLSKEFTRVTEERQRKGAYLMYSRRILRHSRRRRTPGGKAWRACLICAATGVPALLIGYAAITAHGGHASDTADVSMSAGLPGAPAGTDG
jgi:hypothetical protein